MSYQEKRTVVGILTGASVLAGYCSYTFGRAQSGSVAQGDLKFWATSMLIFIGIGIVASIIIQIVFHVLLSVSAAVQQSVQGETFDDQEFEKKLNVEMIEDEMDKLIQLKSMRVGFALAGAGFVAGLISLAFERSPVWMLNILFISFFAGSLLEGLTQLYFYRKGIRNG